MNKEIDKIITKLEGCFGIFDYLLTPVENNLLVSHIKELQQENKQLKEKLSKIETLIINHNCDTGDIYLKTRQSVKGSDSNE